MSKNKESSSFTKNSRTNKLFRPRYGSILRKYESVNGAVDRKKMYQKIAPAMKNDIISLRKIRNVRLDEIFSGQEIMDWMIANSIVKNEKEALLEGQTMILYEIIKSVAKNRPFLCNSSYQFIPQETNSQESITSFNDFFPFPSQEKDNSKIYKVMKMNKYGVQQQRYLHIDIGNGVIRSKSKLKTQDQHKVLDIKNVVKIDKIFSDKERNRIRMIFEKEMHRTYELTFENQTQRDKFCLILLGLNKYIEIAESGIDLAWVPDKESNHCMMCCQLFSIKIRKHHCRNCGGIFCKQCSEGIALLKENTKPVRVCNNCFLDIRNWRVSGKNNTKKETCLFTFCTN